MENLVKMASEVIKGSSEGVAGQAIETTANVIETTAPELSNTWAEFSSQINPNTNENMKSLALNELFDAKLMDQNEIGAKTISEVAVESPKYTEYRQASANTSRFFEDLVNQRLASTDNIQKLLKSFGSDSFPENVEKLAETLGVKIEELPNSSEIMYGNLRHVDLTLKRAEEFGKDRGKEIMNIPSDESVIKAPEEIPTVKTPEIEVEDTNEQQEVLEGDVMFHHGEWFDDNMDEATKEWAKEHGYEDLTGEYTEEEKAKAEWFRQNFYNNVNEKAKGNPDFIKVINEVFDGEGNFVEEGKDATKLLLRIAIKMGIGLAVSIARNIAKDKDAPEELRILMGVFADGAQGFGDFADKAIAGDVNANLQKDIIDFITDKYN